MQIYDKKQIFSFVCYAVGLYIRTFNLTIIPSICVTVLSCVVVYFILLNILNAKIIRPIKEIAKQFRSK